MLIAARESFAVASRKRGWTNPYVTDGLVAMWDGEWNAGLGAHDANATRWADICGLTPLSFETPAAIDVLPKAMRVDYNFLTASSRGMSGQAGFAGTTAKTVELCVSIDSGFVQNQNIFLGPYSDAGKNILCVIALNNNRGFLFKDTMYGRGTSATVSATIAWTGTTAYKNAVTLGAGASNGSSYVKDGYVCIGAGPYQKYSIHCIRLYSRALTAAEIAANYTIDRERFNLP